MTISICITCWHKDFRFLNRATKALAQQTVLPDQFIISSSTLLPEQIASIPKFIADVPVSTINSTLPLYAGGARNQVIHKNTSDIIVFFDIDDIPHPQKVEITKDCFNSKSVDAFVHNFSRGNPPFNTINKYEYTDIIDTMGIYLKPPGRGAAEVHHGHIAIKRDVLDTASYNEKQRRGQDSVFASQLVRKYKYKVRYSPEKLINYIPSTVARSEKL